MSNSGMQRREIENTMLTLTRQVDTRDTRWLESREFSEFVGAWRDLAQYYESSHDTMLDTHILKLYMRYAVSLRHIIEDERMAQRRRQQAKSALKDLNGNLDGVFRQIERNGGARAAV